MIVALAYAGINVLILGIAFLASRLIEDEK